MNFGQCVRPFTRSLDWERVHRWVPGGGEAVLRVRVVEARDRSGPSGAAARGAILQLLGRRAMTLNELCAALEVSERSRFSAMVSNLKQDGEIERVEGESPARYRVVVR